MPEPIVPSLSAQIQERKPKLSGACPLWSLALMFGAGLPLAVVAGVVAHYLGILVGWLGGFIAALVTGVALILQYIAQGSQTAEARFGGSARLLIAAGILVAVLTGLGSWLFGYPFLTSTYAYVTLPVIGKFEVASAMMFDLGVYLAVVGTVLLILTRLGDLSPKEESS